MLRHSPVKFATKVLSSLIIASFRFDFSIRNQAMHKTPAEAFLMIRYRGDVLT